MREDEFYDSGGENDGLGVPVVVGVVTGAFADESEEAAGSHCNGN